MDSLTRRIADYASALDYDDLPAAIVAEAKTRIVDSIGCALGGIDCDVAVAARRLAAGSAPERLPGRIIGTTAFASAEQATFANTAMIRYLDFNDGHHACHPSDMIGAILALAEAAGASGREVLAATVVAYEVALRVVTATNMREKGFDQGFAVGIGTAAGIGRLLGLSAERIGHAVAITSVANVPLRATRAGLLSHWKGAATAFACRNAVYATLLAAEGITGPDQSFEGRHGVWEQLTGPFELKPWASEGGAWVLPASKLKYWPVEGNTLCAVWAALELRERFKPADIAAIDLDTYWSAWHETASEPEKWVPKSRETADHSMPFIFARTFLDGGISVASFTPDKIADPQVLDLMSRIAAHNSEEVEAVYKESYPYTYILRLRTRLADGTTVATEIRNPRGTPQNPMSDGEVDAKFLAMAVPVLGGERAAAAVQALRSIEASAGLGPTLDLLAPA